MRSYLVISFFFFVLGCADNPYTTQYVYNISGAVDIGTPVTGAKVKIYSFLDGKKAEELGSTTSDQNGNYSTALSTSYQGPILLLTSGGAFKDPVSQQTVSVNDEDSLVSILAKPQEQNSVRINAWTTIASARAIGTLEKYGSIEESMQKSVLALEQHLGGLSLNTCETCDIDTKECQTNLPNLLFTLSQLGLSQMAKNNAITTLDLIAIVSSDASDGILDGKKGEISLFFDRDKSHMVDSHLIGFELAKSINQLLGNLATEKRVSIENLNACLLGNQGFYAKISSYKTGELFPKSLQPKPFVMDETPLNIIFDLGSSFYHFENDPRDIGFKEYTTLDIYNFDTHPVLKDGFFFAHAVVTNLMNQPVDLDTNGPSPDLYMLARNAIWRPIGKPVTDPKSLCVFEGSGRYGPLSFDLEIERRGGVDNYVYPHFFEFSTKTGQIGIELIADKDGFISIAPKQAVLIKWSTDIKKKKMTPLLPKGQFPSQDRCKAALNKNYINVCGTVPLDGYMLDVCTGEEDTNSLGIHSSVQYRLVRGFEINLNEDHPYFSFSLRLDNGKIEVRRAYANGPLRSISR